MCEFNVILEGKIVFRDAVYARQENTNVVVRDILGDAKAFEGHQIVEVNVNSTRLVLAPLAS